MQELQHQHPVLCSKHLCEAAAEPLHSDVPLRAHPYCEPEYVGWPVTHSHCVLDVCSTGASGWAENQCSYSKKLGQARFDPN